MWKPQLFERELYSEILDKTFTVTVTMRTLDLIDKAFGFDFYILKASGVWGGELPGACRGWESPGLMGAPADPQGGPVLQVRHGPEARNAAAAGPAGPPAAPGRPPAQGGHL